MLNSNTNQLHKHKAKHSLQTSARWVKLLKDPNFAKRKEQPFTLVFHKYEYLMPKINELLKPHNGNAIVNDPYVNEIFTPVMKELYEKIGKKK